MPEWFFLALSKNHQRAENSQNNKKKGSERETKLESFLVRINY